MAYNEVQVGMSSPTFQGLWTPNDQEAGSGTGISAMSIKPATNLRSTLTHGPAFHPPTVI